VLRVPDDVLERKFDEAMGAMNGQREEGGNDRASEEHPGPDSVVADVVRRSDEDRREQQKEADAVLQQAFEVLALCIDPTDVNVLRRGHVLFSSDCFAPSIGHDFDPLVR